MPRQKINILAVRALKKYKCELCDNRIKKGDLYAYCRLSETFKGKTITVVKKYCVSHSIEQIIIVQKVIARITGKV